MTRSALVRRRGLLVWGAAGLAGLATGGVALSTRIKSPAQLAAESKAPDRTLLTAPVQSRILRDAVVFRGSIMQSHSISVAPTSAWNASRMLVTGVRVRPGDAVEPGQVVAEVSGRPVIVLPGAMPAYRDLRPGASGKDVAQLQQALRGLGHLAGSEATFGASTKAALVKLYRNVGYSPADTGDGDNKAVAAVTAQVKAATAAWQRALSAAGQTSGGVEAAKAALDQAKADLAELEARTGTMLPLSEVVYAPGFPVRVVSTHGVVGWEIQGPLLVLATGDVVAGGTLAGSGTQGVASGQPAEILVSTDGRVIAGKVGAVGPDAAAVIAAGSGQSGSDRNGGNGSDANGGGGQSGGAGAGGSAVVVHADSPIDAKLVGQSVRISVTVAATTAPVLVVPIAAVSAGADSVATVTVADSTGTRRVVAVTVGQSGNGFVEVSAAAGYTLDAGDLVVLGQGEAMRDPAGRAGR
jgi:HlyD family secretion protein